jgi:hypothetical protein
MPHHCRFYVMKIWHKDCNFYPEAFLTGLLHQVLFNQDDDSKVGHKLLMQQQLALQKAGEHTTDKAWIAFLLFLGAMATNLEAERKGFIRNLQAARGSAGDGIYLKLDLFEL